MTGHVILPALAPCPTSKCGAEVVKVPTRKGTELTLDARPDPAKGSVHLHTQPGHTVAQQLGQDAAKAFRTAELPVFKVHRCAKDDEAEGKT